MPITVIERPSESVAIIEAPARLDLSVSEELRFIINDLLQRNIIRIIIDVEKTQFMDSSGLGAVVSRIAMARGKNGDIRLSGLSTYVNELIELTHLNKVLKTW